MHNEWQLGDDASSWKVEPGAGVGGSSALVCVNDDPLALDMPNFAVAIVKLEK